MTEAFRHGLAGYAQDVLVQGRGWTFDPPRSPHRSCSCTATPTPSWHSVTPATPPRSCPTATLRTRSRRGARGVLLEIPQLAAEVSASLR